MHYLYRRFIYHIFVHFNKAFGRNHLGNRQTFKWGTILEGAFGKSREIGYTSFYLNFYFQAHTNKFI